MADPDAEMQPTLDSTGSFDNSLGEDSLVAAAAAAEDNYIESDVNDNDQETEDASKKDKDSDYEAKSSDEEADKDEDEDEPKPGTSSEHQSPALSSATNISASNSDGSDSDVPVLSKRSKREEHRKLMEAAGVLRKSGRQRKEVERFAMKASSDDDRKGKRNRRRGSDKSEDSDGGGSSDGSEYRGSSRKRSKGRDVKRKPKRNQRRRRRGDSSDEGWSSSSGEPKRAVRARTGLEQKKPDYREDSSEGAVDSDDVLEWNEEPAASEDAEQVETIEKVLKHRTGRFGATGHATTRYNVEDRGDPNDGFHPDTDTPQTHYFIKWLNWSHVHNTWEAEDTLRKNKVKGLKKLENYIAKSREVDDWKSSVDKDSVEYYDCEQEMAQELYEQHMIPERIIAESRDEAKEDGNMEYLVKWQGLPYADSTWEDESLVKRWGQDKLDEFQQRSKSLKIPTKLSRALRQRPKFKPFKEQPEFLAEGRPEMQLRDYQLDGLNWLLRAWSKSNSCILADEMGLGKTIQSISFLSALANEHDLYGPFLVVVPLSTLAAWGREFEQWAPDLNVIVYIGDVRSREMIREHEWFLPASRRLKFNCCLTTYEILLKDKAFLGGVEWAGLMVDEAHRLKNDESLLYRSLSEFHTDHRVLVTGTPLQNSLKELWALLHFIMPNLFEAWEDFEERHKSSETSAYQTLHQELEPFLLRRVKKDVEKSLPAKVEQILRVDMTALQKQYYKWILTKNYQALSKGVKGSISGFLNIVMELKKCCNHAYLTRPPEVEPAQPQQRLQGLKKASGKLILLDKLLCQLKETGHRVLIFSQMVMLLDILQEYLQLKKFSYQRLDGTMRGELRKQALDHFNGEGSTDFCFLLSTKAGGLGINLATADTVIIFDSDWNPQNDLQAQSRAHRIGQKRQVNIYRLVTKGTVEEDIVERAKQKLVLDHLVIQRMDTTGRTVLSKKPVGSATPFNKDELSSILKFGAEELFKEGEGEEEEPEVDIEEIMQRAETRETEPSNKQADDLLSAFKVTNFAYDEKTEVGSQRGWEDIIPEAERERIAEEERKVVLNPLAPRARRKVLANSDDNDEEWAPGNSGKKRKRNEDRDSSDSEDDDKRRGGKRQKTAIFNFSEPEVKRFLRSYKKFAHVHKRLEAIAGDAGLEDKSVKELQELCDALDRSFKTAVIKYNQAQQNKDPQSEKKDKGPVFKFGGVEVNLRTLLRPHLDLDPLYQIMPSTPESRKHFTLTTTPRSVKLWDVEWGVEDDCALLRGIYEYGLGSWEAIKMDPQLLLAHKILLPEKTKKPQGKHLQSRADYLLKLIKKQELPSTGDDVVVPGIDPEVVAALIDKPGAKKVARRPPPVATAKEKEKVGNETKEENSGGTVPKKKPRGRKPRSPEGEENKSKHKPKAEEEKKPSEKGVNTEKFEVKEKFTHDLDKQDGKTFKICIDRMKKVQKYIKKMKAAAAPSDFNQSLLKIGDHIQECLSNDTIKDKDLEKWHSYLWLFVGKFFENLNGPKLCQFYRNMKVKPADKQAKPDPDHKLDHHDHGKSHSKQHQASGQHRNRHDHSSHDSRRSHKGSERNSSPWDRSRYEDPRYRKESSHRSSYNQAPNSHSRYGHGRGDEDSSNQSPPHSRHYQR